LSTIVQQVPAELQAALTLINNDPRMRTNNAWALSADKRWSLKFTAELSVPCSSFMPDNSVWHLVLWQEETLIRNGPQEIRALRIRPPYLVVTYGGRNPKHYSTESAGDSAGCCSGLTPLHRKNWPQSGMLLNSPPSPINPPLP